ncbi:MAG: hypothetical protein QNJ38_21375, partial [Prochloraceae cyanobacterium]|nr:hypothetical protein [Prochloraceae cyanobacterium]
MPRFNQAWKFCGSSLTTLLNAAIASYDRALEIDPNCYQAWIDRGVALGMEQEHQQAFESF